MVSKTSHERDTVIVTCFVDLLLVVMNNTIVIACICVLILVIGNNTLVVAASVCLCDIDVEKPQIQRECCSRSVSSGSSSGSSSAQEGIVCRSRLRGKALIHIGKFRRIRGMPFSFFGIS